MNCWDSRCTGRASYQVDGTSYPAEACPIYAAIHDGRVHRATNEVFWRKDGANFPVEYVSTPISEGDTVVGAVVVFHDISDRKRAESALEESQERFRQLAEHIKEVFWVSDPTKTQVIYISPAYEEIWGRSCESLYASPQSWLEAIHPEDRPQVLEAALSKQTIGAYDQQYRIMRPDGSLRWIWDRAFPVRDASGSVYRIVGFAEDITARKRAESALEEAEQRFRSLVANIPGAVYRCACDADWTMQFLSEDIVNICGYPASDFIDNLVRSFASVIHPEDRLPVQEIVGKAVLATRPYELEYRVVCPTGEVRWVYEIGQGIFAEDGRLRWLDGVIFDITNRKLADEALYQSETRYRALFDDSPSMYFMLDAQGTVLSVNRFGSERLGYRADELIGRDVLNVFYPPDREAVRSNLNTCLAQPGTPMSWELRKVRKDGAVIWVRETAQAVRNEKQIPVVLIVCEDITVVKEAERASRESEEFRNQILRSSADCIKVLDLEGRIQFINDSGQTLLEIRDVSTVMNKSWTDFWEGADREAALASLAAAKAGGIGKFVGFCPTIAGQPKWWDVQVTPMVDAQGTPRRLLATSRDITEYRRVQDALRTSEERLAYVVHGSNDGFWDGWVLPNEPWHSPNTPIWYSPRVREMLGFTADEFPDTLESWLVRLHPDDKDHTFAALTAHIEHRVPYDHEYRLLNKQGEYRWFRGRGQGQWDEQGRLIRMAGSLQCITDRKRSEAQLRMSEERLRMALTAAHVGIWDWDVRSGRMYWSAGVEALCGLASGSFPGDTPTTSTSFMSRTGDRCW